MQAPYQPFPWRTIPSCWKSRHEGNPDVFPGFFHVDLANNVLPKPRLLRQFGFYLDPAPKEPNAESSGAHSPRVQPQELATRTQR